MTLGEKYDQWLNDVYRDCTNIDWDELPSWITGNNEPADLMRENDPIMYRCGYGDWAQADRFEGMSCDDCGEDLSNEDISRLVNECCDDDEMECRVCAGVAFRCIECEEVFDNCQENEYGLCGDCHAAKLEEEAEEEAEEEEGE